MNCSACHLPATVKVHGYEVCEPHAHGMMVAVLTGDHTPVGYIIAAACGELRPAERQRVKGVSAQKQRVKEPSAFMRHGALPDPVPNDNMSSRSGQPVPVTAYVWDKR